MTAATRELPVKWRLVDAKTGTLTEVEVPAPRGGYSPFLTDMTWLPDGSRFVAVHWDGTVRLWDPDSRKETRRLALKAGTDRCLAVSADGKWLAVGSSDRTVTVFELSTGSRVLVLGSHDSPVTQVAFTKDGRKLVSNADLSPILWDLCPTDLPADGVWDQLADADGAKAYRAEWALVNDPAAAVKLLGDKVKPGESGVKRGQFDKWVADLDSPQFRVREAAEKELAAAGDKIPDGWLQKAVASAKSDEARTRLGRVTAGRAKGPGPESLRLGRAVQVLELIATPEARALLKTWAAAEGRPVADDATAALDRLVRRL